MQEKVREKSRECHNHAAALPKHKEEEETDKPNMRKSNKRTESTKISSLFPKRGKRNTQC